MEYWRCLRDSTFSSFDTYQRVTDGQTDGQTHDDSICRDNIASVT